MARIAPPIGRYPNVTVVSGPPLAGKNTCVEKLREPGDLVVDWDALAVALGSPKSHVHNRGLWPYIGAARAGVLNQLRRDPQRKAWIITTDPHLAAQWPACRHVQLDVTQDEAHRRSDEAGRPEGSHEAIDDYYRNRG